MAKSRVVCAGVAALLLSFFAAMQVRAAQTQTQTGTPAASGQKTPDIFSKLKFRDLGPAVAGGRVTAVAGIPGNPNVYYVGAAGGGIFKSVDGGLTWKAIFAHEGTASIGAIAIAPSNPNYIWVGTGEGNIRNDLIDGDGVYFSSDAGATWKFMGLAGTQQISSILVDPNDPNTVFVGALGHAWAPNAERGVFKTTDGGKTWKKVLFVSDSTGVSDLEMASGNPRELFACMWEFRRQPWNMVDGGPDSGIYRSLDGGDTWKRLTKGLPKGDVGRSAVAIAPSNPSHIYALIAAKHGMLWQSLNMGDSWTPVTNNHALDVRPFYFTKLAVSPDNENNVFFLSFNLMESTDGGKTAYVADRGVHPDHHAIWIDPKNPNRIIQGNDGGAFLSTDGAKSWRFLDGMPIEQFYMVSADSRQPYHVCGGLQDNSAWCGLSSDLGRGRVTGAAWYTVVGGDGEYAVPAPSDPNIVYADSQDGSITRVNLKTHLNRSIRPYLEGVEQEKPADLKYRFNWTAPIAVSPTDANEVFLGANVVFKSSDGGKTWAPISGDLTRNNKSKQEIAGGPVQHDISGAESYDTILSITLAPTDPNVIWVGTDDGNVQVTRNGGKSWTNVAKNISGAPQWPRVDQVGVSPFNAGAAYVAYDAHELDNRGAYVYRTSDYGATWQEITNGLPNTASVRVVREDPNQRGFLVAGTDTGLFYSSDSGGHWLPLKSNFPTACVYDVQFVKATHDLLVATHGRGILVLNDIRPLEDFTPAIESSAFHLFPPAPGVMYHIWRVDEGQGVGYSVPNAPAGPIIDYYVKSAIKPTPAEKKEHHGPAKIVITDDHGNAVATDYGPAAAGVNQFVWTMQYAGPVMLKYEKGPQPNAYFNPNRGPRVAPGAYKVSVTVDGQTQSQNITVSPDPNLHVDPANFHAEVQAGLQARNELSALNEVINRIDGIDRELKGFHSMVRSSGDQQEQAKYAPIIERGHALSKKLNAIKNSVYNAHVQHNVPEDGIHELAGLHSQLGRLVYEVGGGYGQAPNALLRRQITKTFDKANQAIAQFNEAVKTDVVPYNKAAQSAGAPAVFAGSPITVQPVK